MVSSHFIISLSALGCLKCFCYGVSETCEAAQLGVEKIEHAEGWKVEAFKKIKTLVIIKK